MYVSKFTQIKDIYELTFVVQYKNYGNPVLIVPVLCKTPGGPNKSICMERKNYFQ